MRIKLKISCVYGRRGDEVDVDDHGAQILINAGKAEEVGVKVGRAKKTKTEDTQAETEAPAEEPAAEVTEEAGEDAEPQGGSF